MQYHLSGLLSAVLSTLALVGLVIQLRLIWRRKRLNLAGELLNERPTDVLSVNRFLTSFLAYYSFLMFGAIAPRFNHYLVWPRVGATTLTLAVLFELMIDRRQKRLVWAFVLCAILTASGFATIALRPPITPLSRTASQLFIVAVTAMYLQGGIAQIRSIRRTGHTGGLSLWLPRLLLAKDAATAGYAVVLGLRDNWPVLLLSFAGVGIQATTLYHFRWARLSAKALRRRGRGVLDSSTTGTPKRGR